jgi:hypothetical protein
VHRLHDVQLTETAMGDFARHERRRHDTDDLASRGERGIGDGSHQADAAAAEDDGGAALGKAASRRSRGLPIDGVMSLARAAKDADVHADAARIAPPLCEGAYHTNRSGKRYPGDQAKFGLQPISGAHGLRARSTPPALTWGGDQLP